jgi:hypothetical protein
VDTVTPSDALALVGLGIVLGALGQLLRFVAGRVDPGYNTFVPKRFAVSMVTAITVGAVAGVIGALSFIGDSLTRENVLELIATGYVGTDVVDKFLKRGFATMNEGGT